MLEMRCWGGSATYATFEHEYESAATRCELVDLLFAERNTRAKPNIKMTCLFVLLDLLYTSPSSEDISLFVDKIVNKYFVAVLVIIA